MTAIRIEGAEQLRALSARIAAADKQIKASLRKELSAAAKPITAEQRAIVKGPGGRSTGAASRERAAYRLSRSKSTRASAAASAEKRSGLRQVIAAATGSSASATSTGVNLVFRMRSSQLPPSQRKLGKKWQQGKGWRHPVFGDKQTWVTQKGSEYFDKPLQKAAPALAEAARTAMTAAAEAITHE